MFRKVVSHDEYKQGVTSAVTTRVSVYSLDGNLITVRLQRHVYTDGRVILLAVQLNEYGKPLDDTFHYFTARQPSCACGGRYHS